jgi:hypothetical protein
LGTFTWVNSTTAPTASGSFPVLFTPSASTIRNYLLITDTSENVEVDVTSTPTPSFLPGDADGDGKVTMVDALTALYAANNLETLTGADFLAADMNGNGSIDSGDVVLIVQAVFA